MAETEAGEWPGNMALTLANNICMYTLIQHSWAMQD